MHNWPGRIRRGSLLFIFIAVFVDLLGYGMILPLLPFYVQAQNGGGTLVGLVGALYAMAQFLAGPVLGGISDRYGRRPVLLGSIAGTGGAYLLLGSADTLWLLLLAVLLDGITGGNLATAQAYIVDRTPPEKRTGALGLVGAAFGLGFMLGPAFGGFLSRYGLSVPAFVAAGIAFGNVVFGFFALPESLAPEHRRKIVISFNPVRQLGALFAIAGIRSLILMVFLLNMAFAGLQNNFPLFSSTRFGWDAADNGYFFAFVGICAVITQGWLLGRLQPWFGEARLIIFGLAGAGLSLLLTAVVPRPWMLYPLVALLAVGIGLAIPALTSLISGQGAEYEQGTILSGTQAVLSLTMIFGPISAGLAFDYLGIAAPYVLGALFAGIALIVAIRDLPISRRTGSTGG
jgi:MFS transporter, DHA1 family, tetracycline resistance protein